MLQRGRGGGVVLKPHTGQPPLSLLMAGGPAATQLQLMGEEEVSHAPSLPIWEGDSSLPKGESSQPLPVQHTLIVWVVADAATENAGGGAGPRECHITGALDCHSPAHKGGIPGWAQLESVHAGCTAG